MFAHSFFESTKIVNRWKENIWRKDDVQKENDFGEGSTLLRCRFFSEMD